MTVFLKVHWTHHTEWNQSHDLETCLCLSLIKNLKTAHIILYIQTRRQTADQTLFQLDQTRSDSDRAAQPELLSNAAICSGEPAPNGQIAASSAACCVSQLTIHSSLCGSATRSCFQRRKATDWESWLVFLCPRCARAGQAARQPPKRWDSHCFWASLFTFKAPGWHFY